MTKDFEQNEHASSNLEEWPDDLFLVQIEGDSNGKVHSTLSFSRSPTVLLTFAANRFTRAAARIYQDRYNLGTMDWRLLVMLTREPGATAARASDVIGIDKGAVSRSFQRLLKMGLAMQGELHANGRSRGWNLTSKGHTMHDKVLKEALARQRKLFKGFKAEEIKDLCNMLTRFLDNLKDM